MGGFADAGREGYLQQRGVRMAGCENGMVVGGEKRDKIEGEPDGPAFIGHDKVRGPGQQPVSQWMQTKQNNAIESHSVTERDCDILTSYV